MNALTEAANLDVATLAGLYRSGGATPSQVVDLVYRRIEASPNRAVWLHLIPREQATARALALESGESAPARLAGGGSPQALPLYGIPFAVKDGFDVAGAPTTAACPAFAYTAGKTAHAVERILAAGGILIGKNNMDQFATGLVGNRTPYGKVLNPFDSAFIPGGSSSGSAVAVALGQVSFSLGTDTAGSGRVPAAFNNIVGLKPSRGLISCAGLVPACRSLDCVSIFALTVEDGRQVLEAAMGFDAEDPYSLRDRCGGQASREDHEDRGDRVNHENQPDRRPGFGGSFRFGTPAPSQLRFFGDGHAARLYAQALDRLAELGGERVEIDFSPFQEASGMLYSGPFAAERLEAAGPVLTRDPEALHPIVRDILRFAQGFTALDLFLAQTRIRALKQRAGTEWRKMDLLALPTTGTIYTHDQIEADPLELNSRLGYYTHFVNLLDLCALSLPSGFRPDGLPTGVTLVAPALQDDLLCRWGAAFQRKIGLPSGGGMISGIAKATPSLTPPHFPNVAGERVPAPQPSSPSKETTHEIA